MGVVIVEGEGAVFGVNLGIPLKAVGTLLYSCGKLYESISMSFGVVSGVGRGMGVLEGVHIPQGNGNFRGFSFPLFWRHQ